MKKFLIILCLFLMMPVWADTMPFYMNSIPKNAIGMYQTGENITLYSNPEANSAVIKKLDFSYNPETMPDNVFAVLLRFHLVTVLFPVLQALEPLEQAVALSVVAVKQSEQVAVSVPFEQKSAVQKQIPRYFLLE